MGTRRTAAAARRLRALILAPAPAAAQEAPDPNVVQPSPEESALAAELVARGWVHMKSQLGAHRRGLQPGHPTPEPRHPPTWIEVGGGL